VFKKILIGIVVIAALGVIFSGGNKGATPTTTSTNTNQNTEIPAPQKLTLQDIADKNNLSVGELNKVYKLDQKYKFSDGSYMIVNFQSIKADKQTIIIEDVLPLSKTKELFDKAGFFTAFDENGKQFTDLSFKITGLDNGDSAIIISADKTDLTKCKYLSFGPVDGANSQQILFSIQ
jgi:hypothetical protein